MPSALLDFARDENATQLVIGTSRRSRWARIFDEGIGAAVVQQSGKIDVHMVTHDGKPRLGRGRGSRRDNTMRRPGLPRVVVPSAICAVIVYLLDPYLGIGGESAIFFIGVLVVALLGGVAPAALSARAVRAAAQLLPGRAALHVHHRRARQRRHRSSCCCSVAVAVAALVDGAASRAREARRASQEAELLALFAGSVLRGADLDTLLERVRETYSQRAVSLC